MVWTNILLPSSELTSKPSKKPAEAGVTVSWAQLTFYPKDGGDMFPRNTELSLNYSVST
jgi:hypothetical protein